MKLGTLIPLLEWGPDYTIRTDLPRDVLAGLTLSTLVIPQAMAYAVMASLPPVFGLYSAMFPPLVFFLFAPSPFQNIGPFAVVSVMVSQICTAAVVFLESLDPFLVAQGSELDTLQNGLSVGLQIPYAQVVTLLSCMVGVLQFAAYLSGAGCRVTALLPDSLISAFMAASGVCVMVSQIKAMFGLKISQFTGPFSLLFTIAEIIVKLPETNVCDLILSIGTFFSLVVLQRLEIYLTAGVQALGARINRSRQGPQETVCGSADIIPSLPKKASKTFFDVILTVLLAGFTTAVFDLASAHSIKVIGPIPAGFPEPQVPWKILTSMSQSQSISLVLQLLPGAFSLALVCFVTTYSISKTFAKQKQARPEGSQPISPILPSTSDCASPTQPTPASNLKHQSAQDLLALSLSTFASSFMSCYTPCGSVSRSALLATQTSVASPLGSLIAVCSVAVVILWMGAAFQSVPLSALSVIVVVALKGVLATLKEGVVLGREAWERHRRLAEAMKVVTGHGDSAGEREGIVGAAAEMGTGGNFVVCDAVAVDERSSADEGISVEPELPAPSGSERRTVEEELYLMRLKMVGVYRDVVVWWTTLLAVICMDVGTGILIGIFTSCFFHTVQWGYDSIEGVTA
ncbi:hypothetical protein HDU78_006740 [Chytriomyces hyalinus]|nr:hypothetical protein HDU78_006740 [Chytriomyces hyalinus]